MSLLGTWQGPGWIPNKSTLLQVLISIQGLILVPEPYYNEPGFAKCKNPKESDKYTKRIRQYTLQHAIHDPLDAIIKDKPLEFPEFKTVMIHHFCQRVSAITQMMDEWVANDRGLTSIADKIRAHLHLIEMRYDPKIQCNDGTEYNQVSKKCAAALKAPEIYEIED